MICKCCGAEFTANRRTQKFCKPECQSYYWRGRKPLNPRTEPPPSDPDAEQARINREIDAKYAITLDPGRSIKGKEFRELAKEYAARETRQARGGYLFPWNLRVGV